MPPRVIAKKGRPSLVEVKGMWTKYHVLLALATMLQTLSKHAFSKTSRTLFVM